MPFAKSSVALRAIHPKEHGRILESILGTVDVGVMLTDLDHTTLVANERLGEIFGFAHDEAVRADPEKVRAWVQSRIVNYEAWEQNLAAVYADPFGRQVDELILRDPHLVLERRTSPVLDSEGKPFARLWTFEDCTKEHHQKQIENLIGEISVFFDPSPNAVYGKIVRTLSQFYNTSCVLSLLHGDVMQFQAIASPIPEVQAMTQNELANAYCQFCLEVDEAIVIQNALEHPRYATILPATVGVTRYVGVPLRTPEGNVIGTLCILDHYSDVEVTDDDLRLMSFMGMRVSVELERETRLKALEKDLETAESRMIQNEKLAVAGTLAASVAHDIRNIVSAVTLDLDESGESPEARIGRARLHMTRFKVLAARLLSYVKPKEIARQRVALADVIVRALELLGRHIHLGRVAVTVDVPMDLPTIQADAGRLEHLFVNLILNALQALKPGGKLNISADSEGNFLWVKVSDTGPGMSEDQRARAFEAFQSSRPDGFGLGLYSCRQIMRELEGSIEVLDEQEEGTTMRLRFPIS